MKLNIFSNLKKKCQRSLGVKTTKKSKTPKAINDAPEKDLFLWRKKSEVENLPNTDYYSKDRELYDDVNVFFNPYPNPYQQEPIYTYDKVNPYYEKSMSEVVEPYAVSCHDTQRNQKPRRMCSFREESSNFSNLGVGEVLDDNSSIQCVNGLPYEIRVTTVITPIADFESYCPRGDLGGNSSVQKINGIYHEIRVTTSITASYEKDGKSEIAIKNAKAISDKQVKGNEEQEIKYQGTSTEEEVRDDSSVGSTEHQQKRRLPCIVGETMKKPRMSVTTQNNGQGGSSKAATKASDLKKSQLKSMKEEMNLVLSGEFNLSAKKVVKKEKYFLPISEERRCYSLERPKNSTSNKIKRRKSISSELIEELINALPDDEGIRRAQEAKFCEAVIRNAQLPNLVPRNIRERIVKLEVQRSENEKNLETSLSHRHCRRSFSFQAEFLKAETVYLYHVLKKDAIEKEILKAKFLRDWGMKPEEILGEARIEEILVKITSTSRSAQVYLLIVKEKTSVRIMEHRLLNTKNQIHFKEPITFDGLESNFELEFLLYSIPQLIYDEDERRAKRTDHHSGTSWNLVSSAKVHHLELHGLENEQIANIHFEDTSISMKLKTWSNFKPIWSGFMRLRILVNKAVCQNWTKYWWELHGLNLMAWYPSQDAYIKKDNVYLVSLKNAEGGFSISKEANTFHMVMSLKRNMETVQLQFNTESAAAMWKWVDCLNSTLNSFTNNLTPL